jgi:hypothetical protein
MGRFGYLITFHCGEGACRIPPRCDIYVRLGLPAVADHGRAMMLQREPFRRNFEQSLCHAPKCVVAVVVSTNYDIGQIPELPFDGAKFCAGVRFI